MNDKQAVRDSEYSDIERVIYGYSSTKLPYFIIAILAVLSCIIIWFLERYTTCPVTYTLIGINIIVFSLIHLKALDYTALASSYCRTIRETEYYRVISAAFTHVSLGHLLMNMASLYNLGTVIEPFLGSENFFIVYFIMIMSGVISSWFHQFKSPEVHCIGASGALYGIFGLYLVAAYFSVGISAITSVLPSILFLILMTFSKRIDSWAHFAGIVTGIICGLTLYMGV